MTDKNDPLQQESLARLSSNYEMFQSTNEGLESGIGIGVVNSVVNSGHGQTIDLSVHGENLTVPFTVIYMLLYNWRLIGQFIYLFIYLKFSVSTMRK
jgi:hypothetical protein